ATGVFRLPIDRVFTVKGFGTIVTGTVLGGQVAVGDELCVIPTGLAPRVRGIEVHGAAVDRAVAGHRAALNLGGVANMTVLPQCFAFDSGPSNLLIDGYVALRSGGDLRYDRDGALARAGSPDETLLAGMLDDPYFAAPLPKTTGRERYGTTWLAQHRAALDASSFEDAVATLTALTVCTVADAFRTHAQAATTLIVSGGGARNPALVDGLRAALPNVRVRVSDELGIDADAKESIAFAVLAWCALTGRPAGVPAVTGAAGARVLGALAPFELDALLARARREAAQGGASSDANAGA
ncbi:MAG TPA: anhydro-N-acetylmuramic acid kinase, partial [Candidatus Elarobacter sp.]|nr:anhydro-N-acetylmuramic acid kinase [Candidatus Elarobacter sp.]